MKRKTTDQFILDAKTIHGDKYDYSDVEYINTHTKVTIRCKLHGTFTQKPNSHVTHHQGCPDCGKETHKDTKSSFIEKSIKKHSNKYSYDWVVYVNRHTNVNILCNVHGMFSTTPKNHLLGYGCTLCGINARSKTNLKTNDQFIADAKKIHGNRYDYSNTEYIKAHDYVNINCKTHGSFNVKAYTHLNGVGCAKCNSSLGECLITEFLQDNNISYYAEHTYVDCVDVGLLRFDFYLPEHNMLIEFDGKQHFEFSSKFHKSLQTFQDMQRRDNIKNIYAATNNIPLIRISYKDMQNINIILTHNLLELPCPH